MFRKLGIILVLLALFVPTISFSQTAQWLPRGLILPNKCSPGNVFIDGDATTGQQFYICETIDTWVLQSAVSDTVYGAGWNGDTTVAPSKNAVYDKVETLQTLDATLTALAGLTIADVTIIEGTGADTFNVVTSGGNNYILGSNSGNTALEFKQPTGSGSPVLGTSPTITSPTVNASGGGVIQIPEGTPVNAVAAVGTITMSGIAVADETFVIGAQTFTWKAARGGTGEVTIGANAPAAVTNIVTAVTADLATVTAADGAGDTVVVTAVTKGVAGNSIVFTEASTNMAVDGAGTLGTTTAGVDGTTCVANEIRADASYFYHCIAANTIADTNWRRISLGAAY